jgi:hypothetical protein
MTRVLSRDQPRTGEGFAARAGTSSHLLRLPSRPTTRHVTIPARASAPPLGLGHDPRRIPDSERAVMRRSNSIVPLEVFVCGAHDRVDEPIDSSGVTARHALATATGCGAYGDCQQTQREFVPLRHSGHDIPVSAMRTHERFRSLSTERHDPSRPDTGPRAAVRSRPPRSCHLPTSLPDARCPRARGVVVTARPAFALPGRVVTQGIPLGYVGPLLTIAECSGRS